MSEIVLPDIAAEIHEAIGKEITTYQPKSLWASRLGHPCSRNIVHSIRDWRAKPPISTTQAMIFGGGKVIERHIAAEYLRKAGYDIIEYDRPVQHEPTRTLEKLNIAGKLDFICKKGEFSFPCEVKSMSPHSWEKINAVEDLLFSKRVWEQQYPAQLALYLLGKDFEIGAFLLINKITFEPKIIWMNLDFTFAEELLKKAEAINQHLAKGTYPDRIPYDDQICGKCDFAKVCLGDVIRTEAEILTNDDLISRLEKREQLKAAAREYEELDTEVKKELQGIKKGVAGDFAIIGKEVNRKGYTVEDKVYWQVGIKKL